MIAATSVRVGGATLASLGTVPGGAPAGSVALLPAPGSAADDVGDAITVLLKMSSQLADGQARVGTAQATVADNQRREAALRRKEALDRAAEASRRAQEEAAESSGGFFDFITDNIGVVGLIGLVTFRWDLVAVDVLAHRTELTDGATGPLDLGALAGAGPLGYLATQAMERFAPEGLRPEDVAGYVLGGPLGAAIQHGAAKLAPDDLLKDIGELATIADDDVRVANKIALMVAMAAVAATSTVLTGGTTAPALVALVGIGISTATQIASATGALQAVFGEKAAMYIAIGGAVTGALLSMGGSLASIGGSASAASQVVNGFGAAKSVAEGASNVVAGLRDLRRAELQRDAGLAGADAQDQKNLMKRIEQIIDGILDDLREAKKSSERASEILQGTLQTHTQTLLQAGILQVRS